MPGCCAVCCSDSARAAIARPINPPRTLASRGFCGPQDGQLRPGRRRIGERRVARFSPGATRGARVPARCARAAARPATTSAGVAPSSFRPWGQSPSPLSALMWPAPGTTTGGCPSVPRTGARAPGGNRDRCRWPPPRSGRAARSGDRREAAQTVRGVGAFHVCRRHQQGARHLGAQRHRQRGAGQQPRLCAISSTGLRALSTSAATAAVHSAQDGCSQSRCCTRIACGKASAQRDCQCSGPEFFHPGTMIG